MKQKIKRILLMLCMITCFFALTACQKSDSADAAIDPQMEASMSQWATSLLEQLSGMTEAELENEIALAEKSRDTVFSEGLNAYLLIKSDAGDYQEAISTVIAEADRGYSCTVQASYSNRNVEFKVFIDEDGNITSMSFSPEYTVAEKMVKAAMNTLMGMGTVFAVLIFICVLIGCFKYIRVFEDRYNNKAIAAQPVKEAEIAPVVLAEEVPEEEVDDLELVAVITAAIAASEGTSADGLVVRSIKRASAGKWKRA